MGRRPREDRPGSLHHVSCRGLARRTVVESEIEAQALLVRLICQSRKARILVRAFVFMGNHFHLLVKSLCGELGRAMQEILSGHTRAFNRSREGRDGTIFSGRYWSRPIECALDAYHVTAYVHDHPRKSEIIGAEARHTFCSAWYLLRETPPPVWLDLSRSGRPRGGPPIAPERLSPAARHFVEERIRHPARGPDPLKDLYRSAPAHVQRWLAERAQIADQTQPGMPVVDARTVVRTCREAWAEDREWTCNPSGRRRRSAWRLVAAGLLRDLAGLTYKRIGSILRCTPSNASTLYGAHGRCMQTDPEYAGKVGVLGAACIARCHGEPDARWSMDD